MRLKNIFDPHLDHEQDDEEEDEGGVKVGHVEGGTESPDESVAPNYHGQKHCCKLWAQISHKAEKETFFRGLKMFVSEDKYTFQGPHGLVLHVWDDS